MLALNPGTVTFGSARWTGVTAVTIDRSAERLVESWSDTGPHVVLVDVPEQRVSITVVREITADAIDAPRPGESGELTFCLSPAAAEASRERVRTTAVIIGVDHRVVRKNGAIQTISLVCVSMTGATDPITIEDASDGTL